MSIREILALRSAIDFALDHPIPWGEIFGIIVSVFLFWLILRCFWSLFATWNWYHLHNLKVGWWMFRHRQKEHSTGAPQIGMDLMLSHRTIRGACENDILACIEGEEFYGILSSAEDGMTYIQCVKYDDRRII